MELLNLTGSEFAILAGIVTLAGSLSTHGPRRLERSGSRRRAWPCAGVSGGCAHRLGAADIDLG